LPPTEGNLSVRQGRILEILGVTRRIKVTVLSDILEVSQVTIRKDLDFLEARGLIRREQGIARLYSSQGIQGDLVLHYPVKQRIARAAAELVKDGETVMIEGDSLCTLLAEELAAARRDLTIITNSVFIAAHLPITHSLRIILLGGFYDGDSQSLGGPFTIACGKAFFVDKFFTGVDGFSPKEGFSCRDQIRGELIRSLRDRAAKVIVLVDSEKFSRSGVTLVLRLEDLFALYTDDGIPPEAEHLLLERKVLLVKVEGRGTASSAPWGAKIS